MTGVTGASGAPSRDELSSLLGRDLDELYADVAASDPRYEDALFGPGQAVAIGRAMIDDAAGALRRRICVEWDYCARRKSDELGNSVDLATVLGGVIVGSVAGLPVATVAVILVKIGLGRFCGCKATS